MSATADATARVRRGVSGHRRRLRLERVLLGTIGIVAVLVAWDLLVRIGVLNEVLVSTPGDVAETLKTLVTEPVFWTHTRVTMTEWVVGFGLGALVGVPLGIAAGWFRWVRYIADPWLNILYAAPELAFVPMFILWFGIGMEFKIWLAFLSAVVVIAVNTVAGVHGTEAKYLAVSTTYGASRSRVFRTVVLPGSVPYIVTGLRQGSARALVGVVAAEFLSANQGLGFFINISGQTLNMAAAMAGIVVLATFGILLGEIFGLMEGRFDAWRRSE